MQSTRAPALPQDVAGLGALVAGVERHEHAAGGLDAERGRRSTPTGSAPRSRRGRRAGGPPRGRRAPRAPPSAASSAKLKRTPSSSSASAVAEALGGPAQHARDRHLVPADVLCGGHALPVSVCVRTAPNSRSALGHPLLGRGRGLPPRGRGLARRRALRRVRHAARPRRRGRRAARSSTERRAWEKKLASGGWTCVGWPREHGGRGLLALAAGDLPRGVRARGRARAALGHIGETLLGPTLHRVRHAPRRSSASCRRSSRGEEIWCQGYSEPNAGSDLANVQTRARLDGDEWVIDGQKVWTSWAEWADWCFVRVPHRPRVEAPRRALLPPGADAAAGRRRSGRSGRSPATRSSSRCSSTARAPRGRTSSARRARAGRWRWRTLAFERGVSTLGQQMLFRNELDEIIRIARENGKAQRSR